MVSDQEKVANRAKMWGYTVLGMTLGIWDMVDESSTSLSPVIGAHILEFLEKNANMKFSTNDPEKIIIELVGSFIDQFGFASDAAIETVDNSIKVTLKDAIGTEEFDLVRRQGVSKLFCHPVLCAGIAALSRKDQKCRADLDFEIPTRTTTVTFDLIQ